MSTVVLIATLSVPEPNAGVVALAFSPDGKTIAGSVGPLPGPGRRALLFSGTSKLAVS